MKLGTRKRQNHHDNVLYTTTMLIFESQINLKSDKVVKTLPIHHFDVFLADLGLLVQTER